jgi:polysaccharide deacetylase family protein (PEP-CTERM system associated)
MLKRVHGKQTPGGATASANPSALPGARDRRLLNVLTVDVEDYYHVVAFEHIAPREKWDTFEPRVVQSTGTILDLLDRAGVKATFFVLGHVGRRHPALVRRIHRAGHEVACHSYWHRLVYTQTPPAFREDLRRARDVLQDIVGRRVVAYRAPCFSITRQSLWALDVLLEEGFLFDSSMYPTYHDRYGIPGAPAVPHAICRPAGTLVEFPMPVYRKLGYPLPIGGGGYLRLYPYFFTRRGLRSLNARGILFVSYVHPWEVDPDQPRLSPGWLRAFRHYVNLRRTEGRLAQLLSDFRLGTLSQAHAELTARGALPAWDLPPAA